MKRIIEVQDMLRDARDFANAASMAAARLPDGVCPPIIACADMAVDKINKAINLLQQLRAEPAEGAE